MVDGEVCQTLRDVISSGCFDQPIEDAVEVLMDPPRVFEVTGVVVPEGRPVPEFDDVEVVVGREQVARTFEEGEELIRAEKLVDSLASDTRLDRLHNLGFRVKKVRAITEGSRANEVDSEYTFTRPV